MSTIINKIEANLSTYGSSQKHLAKFIINNHESIPNMTITALAKSAYCSPSSVSRFVNKLGYDSYYDFCHNLKFNSANHGKFSSLTSSMDEINTLLEKSSISLQSYKNIFILCDVKSQNLALDCINNQNMIDSDNLFFTADSNHNQKLINFATKNDIVIILHSNKSKNIIELENLKSSTSLLILDVFSSLQLQEESNLTHIKFLSTSKYDQLQQKYYIIQILNFLFYN